MILSSTERTHEEGAISYYIERQTENMGKREKGGYYYCRLEAEAALSLLLHPLSLFLFRSDREELRGFVETGEEERGLALNAFYCVLMAPSPMEQKRGVLAAPPTSRKPDIKRGRDPLSDGPDKKRSPMSIRSCCQFEDTSPCLRRRRHAHSDAKESILGVRPIGGNNGFITAQSGKKLSNPQRRECFLACFPPPGNETGC